MGAMIEVFSNVRLVGFHRWPGAHEGRDYLRSRHRHEFHFHARVRVGHDDRAVEFHDLRDSVIQWWDVGGPERGSQSCEQMGEALAAYLTDQGLTVSQITVSEDGYDGAVLTF